MHTMAYQKNYLFRHLKLLLWTIAANLAIQLMGILQLKERNIQMKATFWQDFQDINAKAILQVTIWNFYIPVSVRLLLMNQ